MPAPNPEIASRQDVEFPSETDVCRGWLTYPARAGASPIPLVIMAHGFGGTREQRLPAYAERFNAAGLATLIFDYRTFGASGGEPRNDLNWKREIADWHAALAFARSLPGVDVSRIALWGTSFAGGLVVSVAAEDRGVAAIVSQCPLLDGFAATMMKLRSGGIVPLLRLSLRGMADLVGAAVGRPARYVPSAGRPGEVAAMTTPDALPGYLRITGGSPGEVTARSTLRVSSFRPIRDAANVSCPALVQICATDSVAPTSAAERAAARMPKVEVVRYPYGHFDVYVDAPFEESVRDQTRFLAKHLLGAPE